MVAGVCSGIAEYLGIDTTLVRILVVVFTIFGGAAVPIYLVAWAIMPDARDEIAAARFADRLAAKRSSGRKVDVPNPYAAPHDTTRPAAGPTSSTTHEPPAA
jgi:phage shock protein PspC (stress-responsive transcriptional regulator)